MRQKNLERAGLFNHFIQAGLFSSIFTFTSNIGGIRIILERSLHAILFPIAITPDAIASLLALFSFANARNKNLGKNFDLIYALTKTALVFTAVFTGLSLIAVHSLFLAAVGSGMFYHTDLSLYSAYHWLKTPTRSPANLKLKKLHKANMVKNAISSLIGGVVITGILTTMVFAPFLGASILAIAGIGTAVTLVLASTYTLYRHFKQPLAQTDSTTNGITPLFTKHPQDQPHVKKGYYYRQFRTEKLAGNSDLSKESLEEDTKLLINEMAKKKRELEGEINRSEGTIKEFLWSENFKRTDKITYLNRLICHLRGLFPEKKADPHTQVSQHQAADTQQDQLFKIFQLTRKSAFQSFFRAVGDIEDITEAVEKHAENYTVAAKNGLIHS